MYKFKQEIRKAQERDPDFVRVEGINILDLQGLSASALSSETIDVVKLASKISDFFPEVRSTLQLELVYEGIKTVTSFHTIILSHKF